MYTAQVITAMSLADMAVFEVPQGLCLALCVNGLLGQKYTVYVTTTRYGNEGHTHALHK